MYHQDSDKFYIIILDEVLFDSYLDNDDFAQDSFCCLHVNQQGYYNFSIHFNYGTNIRDSAIIQDSVFYRN